MDLTNQYNTKLTPEEEKNFLTWAKDNNRLKDPYDYDMRGFWKSGLSQAENAHFPDTFKKPNHPTFSTQSMYHDPEKMPGGEWTQDPQGRTMFIPSPYNLQNMSPNDMRLYFRDVEPNIILRLPKGR